MEGIDSDIFYKLCSRPPVKTDEDYNIEVCIEISKNGSVKYEYDKVRNALVCDRVPQQTSILAIHHIKIYTTLILLQEIK